MAEVIGEDANAERIQYPTITKRLRRRSRFITAIGILLLLLLTFTHVFHKFSGVDSPKCRSIYMYPSYARIDGFDSRYTKLSKKYHLYLYREQGKDKEPLRGDTIQLDGIPVLFIPGNAGSFKQARSIAAASANIYFDSRSSIRNKYTQNLDFFTADFNEDFTAFHGQTMLDQAEYLNDAVRYILSLYSESSSYNESNNVIPESVILLGHSMGGVVARLMPTLSNFQHESVNTYLTLSSPHSAAPVTFDGDILKLYSRMNSFWISAMHTDDGYYRKNVSVISITGGILDDVLPADYTNLGGIVPESNGFTSFTTTIPQVWTPVDHLAIVWCDQLRQILARYLLEIVDNTSKSKTLDLATRMRISRKLFLSGLEPIINQDIISTVHSSVGQPKQEIFKVVTETGLMEFNTSIPMETSLLFDLSSEKLTQFQLLTSAHDIKVYLCDNANISTCVDSSSLLSRVPRSTQFTHFPTDSSWGDKSPPFKFLSLDRSLLDNFKAVYVAKTNFEVDDFLLTSMSKFPNTESVKRGSWKIGVQPLKFKVENRHSITQTISFPSLWSSLVSYRLSVKYSGKQRSFQPFMRQFVSNPYESKWHLLKSDSKYDINMHNVSPFIPLNESVDVSLNFMFFLPREQSIDIRLSVNWLLTLKMLYIRFRLAIASVPIALIALVLSYQFYFYKTVDSKFVSFETALTNLLYSYGSLSLLILCVGSFIVNHKTVFRLLYFLDPVALNAPISDTSTSTNNYMLGVRESFSWWIAPLFCIISVSGLFVILRVLDLVEFIIVRAFYIIRRMVRLQINVQESSADGIASLFMARRLLGIFALSLAVVFYIPYQFAFIIICFIQVLTCIRLSVLFHENETKYSNLHSYNISFLILTLFMAAINAPVVVVFLHNLAIRWETAFRSHHNFFAIFPTLLLVLQNSNLKIPVIRQKYNWLIVMMVLFYLSFYSFIYGIRNLYWVYHIYNILNGVLFILSL